MLWATRELPEPDLRSAVTWTWQPQGPADVTAMRLQLRESARRAPVPAGLDDDDVERLLLAFEELASNGVRHGREPVEVRVVAAPGGWLIDVTDAAVEEPPTPAVGRDPAAGGLGLYLIARLAAAHGWAVRFDRKHVWACIRAAAPA